MEHIVSKFYEAHSFFQCIDTADGTHVGIKKRSVNTNGNINRKRHYTLHIEASTGYNCCFFDVIIKWPGRVHDARVERWCNS